MNSDNGALAPRDLRRRTLKRAIASYNDQSISIEVVVKDISQSGVKLRVKENDLLPDRFSLYIELDGMRVECCVVWRRNLEIGAKFVSEIKNINPLRLQVVNPAFRDHKKISILKKNG